MSPHRAVLAAAGLVSALSGCSLLIDTGDAGAESRIYIDAGADASIIDAGYIPPDASSDDVRAAVHGVPHVELHDHPRAGIPE